MFKHILIPTDGSTLSQAVFRDGVTFAKEINAKVTAVHVGEPFHMLATKVEALTDTREEYDRRVKRKAESILAPFEKAAKEAGVSCDSTFVSSEHPYQAIIDTAREKGCDLIMMASHGRRGVRGLLLGSETQKVLTHGKVPVLVYR